MRKWIIFVLVEAAILGVGFWVDRMIAAIPTWVFPTIVVLCLGAIPVVAYYERLLPWIASRIVASEPDNQRVLRMMRGLLEHYEKWLKAEDEAGNDGTKMARLYPHAFQDAHRSEIWKAELIKRGFNPHTERMGEWIVYLDFAIPYIEEYGIERAREEAQQLFHPPPKKKGDPPGNQG